MAPQLCPSETQTLNPDNIVVNDLPKARFWEAMDIAQWEGYWFEPGLVGPALKFRSTFQAREDDIFLASTMKTGTTWLKSLALCIMQNPNPNPINKDILTMQNPNPNLNPTNEDILTTQNPHFHVPTIESAIYSTKPLEIDIYGSSAPHLLHTHLPYAVLPESIKNSSCKIMYIARNPKDTLISMWHFFNTILRPKNDPYPLQKAVDCFCSGVHQYGSFFDHVVEYWMESRRRPDKILFLKYEEMKCDPKGHVLRISKFVGRQIEIGEVDEILWRCSLERLKNLEVNKSGSILLNVPNTSFFRKGEVGDWINYLTPEMEDRINQISRIKFEAFGLFL